LAERILEDRPLDHPPKLLIVAADINTIGEVRRYNHEDAVGYRAAGIAVVRDQP
jgi:hypothetical protein